MPPTLRNQTAVTQHQRPLLKPTLPLLKTTGKATKIIDPASATEGTQSKFKKPAPKLLQEPVQPKPPKFETILLRHLNPKQQNILSQSFRDKINKLGESLTELALSRQELKDADTKLAQLEDAFGRQLKIQNVWEYQERVGLAGILGLDPMAVMGTPRVLREEDKIFYNSGYPRDARNQKEERSSPSSAEPPQRKRKRSEMENLMISIESQE